jgi:eukaryotic-like serine/threonine-protein kinase
LTTLSSRPQIERPALTERDTSHTLPPELMAEAARRLGWVGLLYVGTAIVSHFGRRVLLALTGSVEMQVGIGDVLSIAAVLMGIAVFVISRRGGLSPKRLLDVGLVFQVAGAFGIAITEFWDGVPRTAGGEFTLVPAECVWIVAYPLVVPNTPMKVLVASLLAASAGPAALAVAAGVTSIAIDNPAAVAMYFLTTNYLCAVVAYVVARIVNRVNTRLKHAREIGSYELMERIGEGGMGEVWRAKHRLLARPAAIKLIRRDVLGSSARTREAIVRRFEREARETAVLGSTHTIDVYDFGVTEEGDFYYVMELLNGLSLERVVREFGPMEPARAVYLLRQVCHSLGEAHAQGLVHRDIKPANIFMCRLGPDDDFVKVLDFGLVKHFETPEGTMLTMEGSTAGTPAYMAPEIALGRADVDGRADLYSLGCVAYYLLTGHPVFSADTPVATALAHVKDTPEAPSTRSEFTIPPALDALILECLAKDPAARPASAFILGERLAATMPPDAWTPQAARTWWELHRVALTGSGSTAAPALPAADEQTAAAGECRRCWPRLDRRLAQRSVDAQ